MIDAFSASAFYVASCDEGPDAYAECFLEWHESNLRSADVPYIFYSGFVMGPGFAYRSMIIAVHEFDSPTMYALLLVYMGLFRATGRINLAKQCFLALLRLICWPLEIAQAMLSGACQILRDFAKGHAVSTDLCLEAAQGNVKLGQGKRFNVTSAKIHSSLNFFFRRVREHHEVLHVPSEPDASTSRSEKYKGRKVRSQGADVELLVQQLKQFHLFDHHGPPRASLSELPAGLVPKNFNLPPAHAHLVDFSRSLNSLETPIHLARGLHRAVELRRHVRQLGERRLEHAPVVRPDELGLGNDARGAQLLTRDLELGDILGTAEELAAALVDCDGRRLPDRVE